MVSRKIKKIIGCSILSTLLVSSLTSCQTKVVKVDTIYKTTCENFSISEEVLEKSSKACVQGIDQLNDKKYSGVIFKKVLNVYYVALPYFDKLSYSSIILPDNSSVTPLLVGNDTSNNICVYSFISSNDYSVIEGSTDTINKTDMIASLSSPTSTTLGTYKEGIVSSINAYNFSTDILLSESDMGGILIDKDGKMIGFLYSYVYTSDNEDPDETFSNYVKGINYAYRYADFIKYTTNLILHGSFTKGLMGITQTNNEYAEMSSGKYGLTYIEPENAKGLAYILQVSGSAKEANVSPGEFVYSVNDTRVYRTSDVSHIMSFLGKGTKVKLQTLDSTGSIHTYSLVLG